MLVPDGLRYSQDHHWVRSEGDVLRVGLTTFAQDALGEITLVRFTDVGVSVKAGDEMGEVEAFKAMTDLYMPVEARIVSINDELVANPTAVNNDPYGAGWLCLVAPLADASVDELLDADGYRALIGMTVDG